MASSSSAALSLYEKYTQLNHQLDEAREKRSALQKQVSETQERLDDYEARDKAALLQSTQDARAEAAHWQDQVDKAQQELSELQGKRDSLAKLRDRLEQKSTTLQELQRMECRNFLAESQMFRHQQCPQILLQLDTTSSTDNTPLENNDGEITRLHAIALAKGWNAEGLPADATTEIKTNKQFEGLELPTNTDDMDWDFWDSVFDVEEEGDDDDIRQKIVDFQEERRLFKEAKVACDNAVENVREDVGEKYETCRRYKEQLETKLQRLSKEIQQLEVNVSIALAERDEGIKSPEMTNETPTHRVSLSPVDDATTKNPYRRRTSQGLESSGIQRIAGRDGDTASAARAPQPPPPPQHQVNPSRSRFNSSRKRKSAFGSSMKIGGAELGRSAATSSSSTIPPIPNDFLGEMEDNAEDDELLSFSPFYRNAREN